MNKVGKTIISLTFAVALLPGCGSNFDEVLFQAASATGQQAFDLFLTDFANALAAGLQDIADDANGGNGNDNGAAGEGDDRDNGGLDGGAIFAANCAACHGADGASGFAPDIRSASTDQLIAAMMLGTHSTIDLSDDKLDAIAVWLGGNAADESVGLEGDAAAGENLFTTSNCGRCHCSDGSGNCALSAPSIIDINEDRLDDILRGDDPHPGGKFDFDNQDLADIAAFLSTT